MLKAEDIMTRDPITVSPDTELVKAARILLENRINGMPVLDEDGTLVGIICQSDLISQQKKISIPSVFTLFDGFIPLASQKWFEKEIKKIVATTVGQVMVHDPVTINIDTGIEQISALMVDRNFHTLPVMGMGQLVGIVGKEDILKSILR